MSNRGKHLVGVGNPGNVGNRLAGKYAKFRNTWFKLVTEEKFSEVVQMHLQRLLEPDCPPQVLALFYKYCMGDDPDKSVMAVHRSPEELFEHVRRMIREREQRLLEGHIEVALVTPDTGDRTGTTKPKEVYPGNDESDE